MKTILSVLTIIGIIVNVATFIALFGDICTIYSNIKVYWKGGLRTIYFSGAYRIDRIIRTEGAKLILEEVYHSSPNKNDYIEYTDMTRRTRLEKIPPIRKWNLAHWKDDIRIPGYPIQLLT